MNIPSLIENHSATLSCNAPGFCPGTTPSIQWRGNAVEGQTPTQLRIEISNGDEVHESHLQFTPHFTHHKTTLTCTIVYLNDIITEQHVDLIVECEYLLFIFED